jgi:NAD(P)-dependent dehydrogenase (short-subunit alcohol dehydrogenase family)
MAEDPKTLLLTGASRGIGHATVKRFAREGWRVITCSRQPFPEQCPWGGGQDDHIEVDLGDPNKTIEAIKLIRSRLEWQAARAGQQCGNFTQGARAADHA